MIDRNQYHPEILILSFNHSSRFTHEETIHIFAQAREVCNLTKNHRTIHNINAYILGYVLVSGNRTQLLVLQFAVVICSPMFLII